MNPELIQLTWKQLPELPDPEGFAGMYAGLCGECLIAAGGANFPEKPLWEGGPKRWTDRIFMLREESVGWEEAGRLPLALGYGASVSLPKGVMLIGGTTAEGVRRECYVLRLEDGRIHCEETAPLPLGLTGHSAVLCEGKVYVTGGSSLPGEQDALNRLFIYDLSRKEWSEGPQMEARGRFLHQSAEYGGKVYVLGGIGLKEDETGKPKRDMLKEAWSYSEGNGWKRLADLPRYCAAAPTPAPVWGGKIMLLGGDDATRSGIPPQEHPGFHRVSLAYDIRRNRWDEGDVPEVGRAVLPCVLRGSEAIIVNGEQKPGKRSNQVWSVSIRGEQTT